MRQEGASLPPSVPPQVHRCRGGSGPSVLASSAGLQPAAPVLTPATFCSLAGGACLWPLPALLCLSGWRYPHGAGLQPCGETSSSGVGRGPQAGTEQVRRGQNQPHQLPVQHIPGLYKEMKRCALWQSSLSQPPPRPLLHQGDWETSNVLEVTPFSG